ncbi:hypothetical protein [Pseudomonas sp. QTF5]|uniref:hypothetical protein n=1 Tax=Pseudomonas sp. QTF5 TaxID=1435425 RepID=UPI00117A187F|nr:hypothetical protein [Pseudomonas sp. QTF5]
MTSLAGFTFNRIVIIQSLEPDEVETGKILSEYLTSLGTETESFNVPIEIISCSHANQFLEILHQLTQEAATGNIPLIHVECHGDQFEGLEFENSSTLSWERVAAALLPLNIASRFNLLAVFSACFGAYFLGQMGAIQPCPCWCLVAPTKRVDVAEVLSGFRTFYYALFNDIDLGSATHAISKCRLSHGRWLSKPAEIWFENLVTGYIKEHCTKQAARKRAKIMFRQLKKNGTHRGIGALLRMLRNRNKTDLLDKYFETYFITKQIPENSKRFENSRKRVQTRLSELRDSRQFYL